MWYIGTSVNTCYGDKGDCLLCFLLIGKPIGDSLDGGISVDDDIAKSGIVDLNWYWFLCLYS